MINLFPDPHIYTRKLPPKREFGAQTFMDPRFPEGLDESNFWQIRFSAGFLCLLELIKKTIRTWLYGPWIALSIHCSICSIVSGESVPKGEQRAMGTKQRKKGPFPAISGPIIILVKKSNYEQEERKTKGPFATLSLFS